MEKIIVINKPVGMTPLQAITKFKKIHPIFTNIKMSYAGRLDPLAHGILLLVYEEAIKHKEEYLALPKEYEFEVIFGLETDTYDVLGFVENINIKEIRKNVNIFVNTFVNNHLGKQLLLYPPYSSKTVNGKPLFWWAKNKKLHEIEIPKREIEIFDFLCVSIGKISIKSLEKQVFKAISLIEGDFRQKEIIKRWEKVFFEKNNQNRILVTAKFKLTCSSGTYVRELVNQMGKEISSGATVIDIKRTRVGNYVLKDSLLL